MNRQDGRFADSDLEFIEILESGEGIEIESLLKQVEAVEGITEVASES